MSTPKNKLKNMMEKYLNVVKKNEIEIIMDRTLIDYLIQDLIPYFFSDVKSTNVLVRWDV